MSTKANSQDNPEILPPETPNPLRQFVDYVQMPILATADTFSFRIIMYFLEGVLIGLGTYLWLEHAQMGKLYHWLFPIIVAALIVIFHFAFVEIAYKLYVKGVEGFLPASRHRASVFLPKLKAILN